jgi:nucleotide-binding universal stress UspA family protein
VVTLPVMSGYEYGPIDIESMQAAARTTLDDALASLRAEYNGEVPVQIETEVPTGHVGIELLRAAEEDGGAAMVVVGSRGYGGFKSLLLGSVTTYLAHHLTCPLLIIPGVDE